MINKSSGIPVYKQIVKTLRMDIDRGKYPAGQKLPSEDDLAEQLGASRGTIRQALSELSNAGIVKRVHGNGTFVCEPGNEYRIETDHFISILDGLEQSGIPVETVICEKKATLATGVLSKAFAEGLELFEISRIRLKNNTPVMFSLDYIPMDLTPNIHKRYLDEKSVYDFLEENYSLRVCKVKRTFYAVAAEKDIAKRMSIPMRTPLFYIIQQAFDEYSRCVDFAELYIVGQEMHFSVMSSR